ncbi:MAG TPA: carbon storage regulator CsrA [Tissierellaceae bacterium]|nr:carbon storage regulator CsrA [Tissierellaceae bacterium]
MLILNRKANESIMLDDKIEIRILEVQEGKVKLGIEAPKEVTILRKEVYDEVIEANKKSLDIGQDKNILEELNKFNK